MDSPTLLFFGTFNPPTLGHLFVIKQALTLYPQSDVWVIPADRPIWDKEGVISYTHRAMMLDLLLAELPFELQQRVKILDMEHTKHLSGKSKETLDLLLPEYPDHHFRMIMGADSFASFDRWYEWKSILTDVEISVIPRAELFTKEELLAVCSPELRSYIGKRVIVHQIPDQDERWFSSTQTKEDLELQGKSVQVPHSVFQYIQKNRLYDMM